MQKIGAEFHFSPDRYRPGFHFREQSDSEKELRHYSSEALRVAVNYIEENYASGRPHLREQKLFFHRGWHTEGVVWRAGEIMLAMHKADPRTITMRDVELAKVAAAFHDVIQYSHIDERQRPSKKRYREAGRNEVESAQAAVAYMNQVNEIALSHGRARVYFKEDIEKVREAILFTDPTGCWNDTLKTVAVPGDKFRRAGIIAQVVQLADLGASGMNPEIEAYCSLALFTEENMDFREEMDTLLFRSARRHVTAKDREAQDEKRAWYHQRLMQWFVGQDAFIAGRQKATESEINALNVPENLKNAVAALFPSSNFLKSRQAEATLAAHYSKTTKFEDWAIDINDALVRVPRFS